MKKALEELEEVIGWLRLFPDNIPTEVYDKLDYVKGEMVRCCRKRRCEDCNRYEHYDEVMGIWLCERCDDKPDNTLK